MAIRLLMINPLKLGKKPGFSENPGF